MLRPAPCPPTFVPSARLAGASLCPVPGEFNVTVKVFWAAGIPLLVASLAIAVSEQEQRDAGGWQRNRIFKKDGGERARAWVLEFRTYWL